MEFGYKIKDRNGEILEGRIEAPDENIAIDTLHSKNYVILSLNLLQANIFSIDLGQFFSKPNNKDIVGFTRQLSTLIDADMPLAESLRTLAKQTDKSSLRKTLIAISEAVESGSVLSAALAMHPKLFSSFYVKLVQSGELSGKLQESLLYMAEHLERNQIINFKIKNALAYPVFIIISLFLVTILMVVYVLPNLLAIFKDQGIQNLPLTTRFLIFVTDFIGRYFYFLLGIIALVIYIIWNYIRTPNGKDFLDNLKINFPIIGAVAKNLYLVRISESLSTLIKSGIPILDALQITADLVGNLNYKKIMLTAKENVRSGGDISDVLIKYKEIPPLMFSMVAIGEKTGKLNFMLEHLAKFYKSESDTEIDSISQLIEPILIVIIGLAVAILVSAILLPIYNLVGIS